MKIVLWSDVHCHLHRAFARYEGGTNSRLADGLRVIDQVTEVVKGCDCSIFLGDLFHVPAPPAPVFNEVYERIKKLTDAKPLIMLAGNHDLRGQYYSGDPRDIPFLKFLRFPGVHGVRIFEVEDTGTSINLGGTSVFGFNHRREAEAAELIAKAGPHDVLVMHQDVYGADNDAGREFRGGLRPDDLRKFTWTFTGHVHRPRIIEERVVVVGAGLHIDFGDSGDRCFFVLDTEKGEVEPVETTFPRFVTLAPGQDRPEDGNFYREALTREKRTEALTIPGYEDAVVSYCEQQKRPEYVDVGRKLVEAVPRELASPQPFALRRVELENFGVFGRAEYDVDAGLHMVIGEIADSEGRSNGAGKSTLFEAISWAIYGRTSKGVRGASVMKRDRKRGKACTVTLVFGSPRGELRIERKQTATGSTLDAWLGDHHEHGRVPDVQDWITGTIGVDYEFFQQMVYFSQEQAQFFSEMGDADRKRILGTLLGTRWYEAAAAEAKNRRDVAQELNNANSIRLRQGADMLAQIRDALELDRGAAATWEGDHKLKVENITIDLADVGKQLREARGMGLDQRAEIDLRREGEIAALDSGYRKAVARVGAEQSEQAIAVESRFTCRGAEIDKSLGAFREKVAKLGSRESLAKERERVEVHVNELRAREMSATDAAGSLYGEEASLAKQLETLRSKIAKIQRLETGVRCQTCGSPITAESREACLAEMAKEADDLDARLTVARSKLVEAKSAVEASRRDVNQAVDRQNTILESTYMIERLEGRVAAFEAERANLAVEKAAALAKVEADAKEERSALDLDDRVARARVEERYAKELADLDRARAVEVSRLEERGAQLEASIAKMRVEVNPHVEARDRAARAEADQIAKNEELSREVKDLAEKIDMFDFWARGFGREGIQAALLHDFCRVFTSEVNDTLTQMGLGMSAELSPAKVLKSKKDEVRDQLDYRIRTTIGEMEYAELSGGEKVRIDLASMLALNLIASRHFKIEDGLFGILVLDEIFSSLDEAGVEVVYQIISGFTARSVYVISHDPSMKSMFDKVLTVQRDGTDSVLVA